MNALLVLASALISLAAYFYGVHVGEQGAEAQKAREERIGRVAYEEGQKGAAAAIAKLKPRNITIRQELAREIQTNTVYRDCRVPADGVRLVNDALLGRAERSGPSELPRTDTDAAHP